MPIQRRLFDAIADRIAETFVGALLVATLGGVATAGDWQAHASITDAARQHALTGAAALGLRPEVEVDDLDRRLRLAACDQPLTTFDSPNGLSGGRGVVGVRCEGSTPWKIFVGVRLSLFEHVVVLRNPVARGEVLDADDLAIEEADVSKLRKAYYTDTGNVLGLRARRSLDAGTTLHAGLVKRARLVKRGRQVQIVASLAGLHVTMQGKALEDGGRGDRVRVENLKSGQVVYGTVTRRGIVEIAN